MHTVITMTRITEMQINLLSHLIFEVTMKMELEVALQANNRFFIFSAAVQLFMLYMVTTQLCRCDITTLVIISSMSW